MKENMNNLTNLKLCYTACGFIILFLIISSCSSSSGPVTAKWKLNVDVNKINESAAKIQDAFAKADTALVKDNLTESCKKVYGTNLTSIIPKMKDFATAFATRTLVAYSEQYAEYSFSWQGKTYTVALTRQNDNTWKLTRF